MHRILAAIATARKLTHKEFGTATVIAHDACVDAGIGASRTIIHVEFQMLMGHPSEIYWFTLSELFTVALTGKLPLKYVLR